MQKKNLSNLYLIFAVVAGATLVLATLYLSSNIRNLSSRIQQYENTDAARNTSTTTTGLAPELDNLVHSNNSSGLIRDTLLNEVFLIGSFNHIIAEKVIGSSENYWNHTSPYAEIQELDSLINRNSSQGVEAITRSRLLF